MFAIWTRSKVVLLKRQAKILIEVCNCFVLWCVRTPTLYSETIQYLCCLTKNTEKYAKAIPSVNPPEAGRTEWLCIQVRSWYNHL